MPARILPSQPMQIALAIAGSDPTGGAGLQLDLQVFRSLGVHGAGVVTALTIQDTAKVHQVLPVFPSVVLNQMRRLLEDFVPDAIKIGMLASDDVLRSVALGLEAVEARGEALPPIVIDPVLVASDGQPLLERRAWDSLKSLIARATLVTPNLPEAEALTGVDVSGDAGVETAARFFVEQLGAGAALLKGGHRKGSPDDLLARPRARRHHARVAPWRPHRCRPRARNRLCTLFGDHRGPRPGRRPVGRRGPRPRVRGRRPEPCRERGPGCWTAGLPVSEDAATLVE